MWCIVLAETKSLLDHCIMPEERMQAFYLHPHSIHALCIMRELSHLQKAQILTGSVQEFTVRLSLLIRTDARLTEPAAHARVHVYGTNHKLSLIT